MNRPLPQPDPDGSPRRRIGALAWSARWGFSLAVLAASVPASPGWAEDIDLSIKATYLYKFAPFVEWPPSAFSGAATPLTICLQGPDPFGPLLDHAVLGKGRGPRPFLIRRIAVAGPDAGCQILYARGSREQSVAAALKSVEGAPVLTVTDAEDDARSKGMINLVLRGEHVRFEIDQAAAQASGMTLSSKLLDLAVSVRRAKAL
jgi:hypothetical protein